MVKTYDLTETGELVPCEHKRRRIRKCSSKGRIIKQADTLLQQYLREKYRTTLCYACGERVMNVGHHFITKANSTALRYYIPNLIPLCTECHCKVHTQPHLVEPKICFLMGEEWYNDLMTVKRQGVKVNMEWCRNRLEEMQGLLATLKGKNE